MRQNDRKLYNPACIDGLLHRHSNYDIIMTVGK